MPARSWREVRTVSPARCSAWLRALAIAALLGLAIGQPALAVQKLDFPAFTGHVVDEGRIFGFDGHGDLAEALADHERKRGEKVVVVSLRSLQGVSIEEFARRLQSKWGLFGKQGSVLIVIAAEARKVRIHPNHGAAERLSHGIAYDIIDRTMLPKFEEGDYRAAAAAGALAVLSALKGEYQASAISRIPIISQISIWFSRLSWWMVPIILASVGMTFLRGGRTSRRKSWRSSGSFGGGGGASGSW